LNYAPVMNRTKPLGLYRVPNHSLRQDSTPLQKIKRKYYNIFTKFVQQHF